MNPRMKKAIQAVLLPVIAVALLSACQPTPSAPVIVNKNGGQLEQALQKTDKPAESKTAPSPYEAPKHWSETVNDEKLTIKIDTDIKMPSVNVYPVIKVEPAVLTQQQVDNLVNYFAAGKKLYKPHVETKSEYKAEIVEAKRGQEVDGKYVVTEDSKDWVKELEKRMASAPDESPKIYTDTNMTYRFDHDQGKEITTGPKAYLDVMIENGDGKDGRISFSNCTEGYYQSADFYYSSYEDKEYLSETDYNTMKQEREEDIREGIDEGSMGWDGYDVLYGKVTMKEEDALTKAQKVLNDLGIKDMALTEASKTVSKYYPDKGGYELQYERENGGIVGYSDFNGGSIKDVTQYSPPFTVETVTMTVTEDGVISFGWDGIAKVVETVNDNVALLPFDKIQQALKNQIKYKESTETDMYGMKDFTVNVVSAELRMGYIGVKDNVKQALFIPVWVFETQCSHFNSVLNTQQTWKGDAYVFSAIDGGTIDVNWKLEEEEMEAKQ